MQNDELINIVSNDGSGEISINAPRLDYLINEKKLVHNINPSEYDIHLGCFAFPNLKSKKQEDEFKKSLYKDGITNVKDLSRVRLIDLAKVGITMDYLEGHEDVNDKSLYYSYNKFVNSINKSIEKEKERELSFAEEWKNIGEGNTSLLYKALLPDIMKKSEIIKIAKKINRNVVKIHKLVLDIDKVKIKETKIEQKNVKLEEKFQTLAYGKYADNIKLVDKLEFVFKNKRYNNLEKSRLAMVKYKESLIEQVIQFKDQIHEELMPKEEKIYRFYKQKSIFKMLGFKNSEYIDDTKRYNLDYLYELLQDFETFFAIYGHFLNTVLEDYKELNTNKLNDIFKINMYNVKVKALNNIKNIYSLYHISQEYDNVKKINMYLLYEFFKLGIRDRIDKIIKKDIERRNNIEDTKQSSTSIIIGGVSLVSLITMISFNFTLLKDIWKREILIGFFALIVFTFIFVIRNILNNRKAYKIRKDKKDKDVIKTYKNRKKKNIIAITAFVLAVCILSTLNIYYIYRYDGYDDNFYYVNGDSSELIIDGIRDNKSNHFIVPEKIDDRTVDVISLNTFNKNKKVRSIDLTQYKGTLLEGCFKNSKGLLHVKLPESATELPAELFKNCSRLGNVEGLDHITKLGKEAFAECPFLFKIDITKMEDLGVGSFRDSGVKEVIFGEDLEVIPEEAFWNCHMNIKKLPNSIKEIKHHAFGNFANSEIVFGTNIENIDEEAMLYSTEKARTINIEVQDPEFFKKFSLDRIFGQDVRNGVEIVKANYIKEIPTGYFSQCKKLKQIDISNIEKIGDLAFKDCQLLTKVVIGKSRFEVGKEAFCNCSSLEYNQGFEKIKGDIQDGAFNNCVKFKKLLMNNEVTRIGCNAFRNCKITLNQKEQLHIPDYIENVGTGAFIGNDIYKINISNKAYNGAFADLVDYYKIEHIVFRDVETIPDGFITGLEVLKSCDIQGMPIKVGDKAFYDTKLEIDNNKFSHVTSFGDLAFYKCRWLTSINSEDPITELGENTFGDCENLKEFNWNLLQCSEIPAKAFAHCKELTNVYISDSVEKIGDYAFAGDYNMVISNTEHIKSIGAGAFNKCNKITEFAFNMDYMKNPMSSIFADHVGNIKKIKAIGGEIIPERMFKDCSSLVELELTTNPVEIQKEAFFNCYNLKFKYPYYVKIVGDRAFYNSGGFEKYSLDDFVRLEIIGDDSFRDCLLNKLILSDKVVQIGKDAFKDNYIKILDVPVLNTLKLEDYVESWKMPQLRFCSVHGDIPNEYCKGVKGLTIFDFSKVSSIGDNAFEDTGINYVILPENIILGKEAFKDCNNLQFIQLNGTTVIPDGMFKNCLNLEKIENSGTICEVGNSAFEGCDALQKFDKQGFLENCKVIGNKAFAGCKYFGNNLAIDTSRMTKIGTEAFKYTGVTKLIIGNNGCEISDNAFSEMKYLSDITIDQEEGHNLKYYFGDNNFNYDSILRVNNTHKVNKDYFGLRTLPNKLILEGDANIVEEETFRKVKVDELILPDNILLIGKEAFAGAEIGRLQIPENTKIISEGAFKEAILKDIWLVNIEDIGDKAFYKANIKNNVIRLNNIKNIGDNAFKYSDIKKVILSDDVERIGFCAFDNEVEIENLENQVNLSRWDVSYDSTINMSRILDTINYHFHYYKKTSILLIVVAIVAVGGLITLGIILGKKKKNKKI